MRNKVAIIAMAGVLAAGVLLVMSSDGRAAERGSRNEYEISVDAQKSDTVRMIEAYERLSDQYLKLVQQNLVQMSAADRDILAKLNTIDKKLDDLSARLANLEKDKKPADPVVPTTK